MSAAESTVVRSPARPLRSPRAPRRRCSPAGRLLMSFAVLVLAVPGCDGDDPAERPDGADAGQVPTPSPTLRRGIVRAVQLGSFADSANAVTLRDSLTRAGWTAYLSPAVVRGESRWRVLVQPTPGAELPRLLRLALRDEGREVFVVRDTLPSSTSIVPMMVEVYPVNRGSEGMLRTVRWARSPDRRSLLAVEDPAGVENEPVPNGFVFVSETGPFFIQVDSVWDVSPSPDWQQLAFGRAYGVMSSREAPDRITDAQWQDLADQLVLGVDSVRRASFVSSSMNIAYATAQPVVVDVSDRTLTTDASLRQAERTLEMAGGWRIGWTPDGGALLVGGEPERAVDDAPPRRWIVVDTTRWEPTRVQRAAPWTVEWVQGPLLDISVPFDVGAPRSVAIDGGRVTSRQGWIRILRESAPSGTGARPDSVIGGKIVGPGAVLAATATGEFIAALVPRETADQFEVSLRFIVYQIVE